MNPAELVYLKHILDAIAKVEAYLQGIDEAAFNQNPLVQPLPGLRVRINLYSSLHQDPLSFTL